MTPLLHTITGHGSVSPGLTVFVSKEPNAGSSTTDSAFSWRITSHFLDIITRPVLDDTCVRTGRNGNGNGMERIFFCHSHCCTIHLFFRRALGLW